MMASDTFDRHMMGVALAMAQRGLGTTAPNPSVGAVIVDTEAREIIARAVTKPGGRPHAETQALLRAGARAKGSTVYVTLEPCAHHGKTPPCTDALITSGAKRVVVGVEDPDPRTAGEGIARLRAAGIEVVTDVRRKEAQWLTLGHSLRVTENRPFVQLKLALAPDGDLPRGRDGEPQWVTGLEARAHAHMLRAEADAILVGSGTVRDDNPELTCRLPGLGARSPIRVVLSRSLDVSLSSRLVATAHEHPLWLVAGQGADPQKREALAQAGADFIDIASDDGGFAIKSVLAALASRGITRLLVEGGPAIWKAFASSRLVDEVIVFQAGHGGEGRLAPTSLLDRYAPGLAVSFTRTRRTGDDEMHIFRRG